MAKNPAEELAAKLADVDAVLARLKEKEAELDAKLVGPAQSILEKREPPPLPARFKGKKTYRLTESHYRKGVVYQAGELITVEDEVPGRTWVEVDPNAPAAPTLTNAQVAVLATENTMSQVASTLRPNDRDI